MITQRSQIAGAPPPGCASLRKIGYLTIDDGPTEDFIARVDYLDARDIKAIWTCCGRDLEKYGDHAVYAIRKGHVIGNHSYSHPNFAHISLDEAQWEILKTDRIIEDLYLQAGTPRPAKIFRFPFLDKGGGGDTRDRRLDDPHVRGLQTLLEELGYRQPAFENVAYRWWTEARLDRTADIDCSFDTLDWALGGEPPLHDLPTLLARIDDDLPEEGRGINDASCNDVIMMHAWIAMDAFTAFIEKFLEKGVAFRLPRF
jgi:peptidoglycan-N-acetylglucosamine deacetylase